MQARFSLSTAVVRAMLTPRLCALPWSQASLQAAQKLLEEHLATVKAVAGVKSVQRVVCGGCLDFKMIIAVDADAYGAWEAAGHAPEPAFLEAAKAIPGVTAVETQTFTLMPM
jgi:hypothetical protein